ncbi:unnamed protein product, partial [Leptidea sinapis]
MFCDMILQTGSLNKPSITGLAFVSPPCNSALEQRLEEIDQSSCKNNIETVGIEQLPNEDVKITVDQIGETIGISCTDIGSAKRSKPLKPGAKPAPIVVVFKNTGTESCDKWLAHRRKLTEVASKLITGGSLVRNPVAVIYSAVIRHKISDQYYVAAAVEYKLCHSPDMWRCGGEPGNKRTYDSPAQRHIRDPGLRLPSPRRMRHNNLSAFALQICDVQFNKVSMHISALHKIRLDYIVMATNDVLFQIFGLRELLAAEATSIAQATVASNRCCICVEQYLFDIKLVFFNLSLV